MKSSSLAGYTKLPPATLSPNDSTLIGDNETIYEALNRMGLLRQPNHPFGNLVREGELGLSSDDGKPMFLAPGRHRLWSPFNSYKGNVSISQKLIQLGNIQIVTVDQSELGLSTKKGENIILQPGQHILRAPHKFVKCEQINKLYVHLGTYHRISIPVGKVAVVSNEKGSFIITPEMQDVDKKYEKQIHCTNGEMYEINSPTFMFDPATGFKSVQLEDIELDPLTVNTGEFLTLTVVGSVRFQVKDPVRAFLLTENVVANIKEQAMATLTAVFQQLSIGKLASGLAATHVKDKGKADLSEDMLHEATDLFMNAFQVIVEKWGVHAELININSMQIKDKTFLDTINDRAKQTMQAQTKLAVIEAETRAVLQEAERGVKKATLEADAKAGAIRSLADAELYAAGKRAEGAKMLASEPLAQSLALMDGQAKIVKEFGNNTMIISRDFDVSTYGLRNANGGLMFVNPAGSVNDRLPNQGVVIDGDAVPAQRINN